jgi:hypothetical protein
MADPASPAAKPAATAPEPAAYLDMPEERRELAKAHAAMLAETAGRVALELPLGADVDDFRRVLAAGAPGAAEAEAGAGATP